MAIASSCSATPSAISTSEPVVTEYREGGWNYDALAEQAHSLFEGKLQTCGEKMPPLPEELQPAQG